MYRYCCVSMLSLVEILFSFAVGYGNVHVKCVIMDFKQRERKFKARIKLDHNR